MAAGRGAPLPEYVDIILTARWWGYQNPEEYLNTMPSYWDQRGRIVRHAEHEAQRAANRKH